MNPPDLTISMHRSIVLLFLLFGCTDSTTESVSPATLQMEVAGNLENPNILEASGLARSQREPGVLWIIDDDRKPVLHASDLSGAKLGTVDLRKSKLRDWEDLASFTLDGEPYLMVADIGDNLAARKKVRLYFAKEPRTDENKTKVD